MDTGSLKGDQNLPPTLGALTFRTNIVQCSTFTNVYWDLNIKKIRASHAPLNRGPCHGITGILVNTALKTAEISPV